jgi:hypothetical protein
VVGVSDEAYIHLLDEAVPAPTFFDALTTSKVGNEWATRATESGRSDVPVRVAEVAI